MSERSRCIFKQQKWNVGVQNSTPSTSRSHRRKQLLRKAKELLSVTETTVS